MDVLNVKRSKLEGSIKLSGAKNSALKLLSASILTDEEICIENFPADLIDVKIHIDMLEKIGKTCDVSNDTIKISSSDTINENLLYDGATIRNTLLIFGALLARCGRSKVPLPGGCKIGERKFDLHQMLLEKLGAKVWEEGDYLCGEAKNGLSGTDIFLPIRSTGATENGIIAGCLSSGATTIWNPHIRPEIIDLVDFLTTMGAKIEIRGNESIRIQGVDKLQGARHTVIPDNVEAITYFIAAAITGGNVEIMNFPFKHLEIPMIHLRESGARFYTGDNSIVVRKGECYPLEISTGPYPGINSDMQPLFAVYGLCAKGETRITDLRFPNRYGYAEEMQKMGMNYSIDGNILKIDGKGGILQGTEVKALDLRTGAALLLCGLIAKGKTTIVDAWQIERGYNNVKPKFQALRANISEGYK